MNIIPLSEHLTQYQFEPTNGQTLGGNIFVVVCGSEALIIDTSRYAHMEELMQHLGSLMIKHVILTHFHADHVEGLLALSSVDRIGSCHAPHDLASIDPLHHPQLRPHQIIAAPTRIVFHDHPLDLLPCPGHSASDLLILLDDRFWFVGDALIATNDGAPALPYVTTTITVHSIQLERLLADCPGRILLPSHGRPITSHQEQAIRQRIAYMEFLDRGDPDIKNFYSNQSFRFANDRWHHLNLNK